MTEVLSAPTESPDPVAPVILQPGDDGAPSVPEEQANGQPPVNLGAVALAALLASAGAAWLAGGLIQGALMPRLIALLGVGIGVGLPYLALRGGNYKYLQYAVVPIAALVGAIMVAPVATGGTSNLPELVIEAIKGGGLLQPPIAFDPGWRFILVVFFAVLSASAVGLAAALRRDKLALLIPTPVALGSALLQPRGSELVASTVAIALILASFAISYGGQVAAEGGGFNLRFETRRLMRGAAMVLVLIIAMVGLSHAAFLFPNTNQEKIVPPRRPPQTPPQPDRVIFTVRGPDKGPWRVGVLDTYDGRGWLLPAYDPAHLPTLDRGHIPGMTPGDNPATARFHIADMQGRSLPVPPEAFAVEAGSAQLVLDPATQVPGLGHRLPQGFDYTVRYASLPDAKAMDSAPPPTPSISKEFLSIPAPPDRVVALLAKAPPKPFERLQFLRTELYSDVVSAGAGHPVDVVPDRVNQLLVKNAEGSPWEITASEAMLARWAGLPSRIGFGYFGGEKIDGGFAVHPRNGSAWLEVYFQGYGWVPLVGTPPQAKASDSNTDKRRDNSVHASDRIAISILIPSRTNSYLALWEIAQWWAMVLTPIVLALLLAWYFLPWPIKRLRSSRRARWAETRGLRARVLVHYADFRDRCYDLNLGDVRDTPLEFARRFQSDDEHAELAWLVTRVLWGDLARDVRDQDVHAAREMCRSVQSRILERQGSFNLALGAASRASLRDPYSTEVPNLWPHFRARRARLSKRNWLGFQLRRLTPRTLAAAGALLAIGGCAPASTSLAIAYPARLPSDQATLSGLSLVRDPAAERKYLEFRKDSILSQGKVWLVKEGPTVQGTLQVSLVDSDVDMSKADSQTAVEGVLGGNFSTARVGTVRLRFRPGIDQDYYLWFPPDKNALVLFVLRKQFTHATALVRSFVFYQRGYRLQDLPSTLFPVDAPASPAASPSPSGSTSPASSASPQVSPTAQEGQQP